MTNNKVKGITWQESWFWARTWDMEILNDRKKKKKRQWKKESSLFPSHKAGQLKPVLHTTWVGFSYGHKNMPNMLHL